LKEVIVTITEIKVGVPGQFSQTPSPSQSLKGQGNDGKVYEKHWEFWPESQTMDYITQWTLRDDGVGREPFWVPHEAIYVYDAVREGMRIIDQQGNDIRPKGDFVYCREHNSYAHTGGRCIHCIIAERKAA
jgi:hypothetical protein